jgi:hypothetical protein
VVISSTSAKIIDSCRSKKFFSATEFEVKFIVYVLSAILGALGVIFVIGAGQGNAVVRIVIGILCLGAAAVMVMLSRLQPVQTTHVHQTKLDLSGDVALEQLTCKQCGASLSDKSVSVVAGAVFVNCEHCGTQYQIEEAPKW